MKKLINTAEVRDYSGALPTVTHSNSVTTVIRRTPYPYPCCCRCRCCCELCCDKSADRYRDCD